MTDYPDFSPNNYQIISELGRNHLGGRVTYLAQQTTTNQQVVIKQFQFAKMGASWTEYDAYEQEIAMLRHLNHPGIPKYLDSFQTADGFCMVQEYINAQSLAVSRSWSPIEIKKVALAILEILIYLQSLNPSVIHRDLKPENILIDENLNIYLVDFGFARLGGGEIAASSVVKGTMGFMPPEQLFNRQLTTASDLYGLGATLICLLTGTTSGSLGNLIDENYQIKFQHLVPPLKRGLISWLEKISQPNPKDRYANAAEALEVLKYLDVDRLPKLIVNRNSLVFFAQEFRQKMTQTITINNPIPETILTGNWEVAPHKNDPPHTPYDHPWIEFDSYKFEGNKVKCTIAVDTSKLLAGESYKRELLLHSNSEGESLIIPVEVNTAKVEKANYFSFIVIGIVMPFVLFISGFTLALPVIERVLKVNAKEKNVNLFLAAALSAISLLLARFLGFKFNLFTVDSSKLFSFFILLFFMAIAINLVALLSANSQLQKILDLWLKDKHTTDLSFRKMELHEGVKSYFFYKEQIRTRSKINLVLQCSMVATFLLAITYPIIIGFLLIWIILIFFNFYLLVMVVDIQDQYSCQINTIENTWMICGLTLSLVWAYLLAVKFNYLASIYNWNFGEIVLIAVIAIAPVLYFGFSLAKIIVKRWRAIARYNREKPNLIKP